MYVVSKSDRTLMVILPDKIGKAMLAKPIGQVTVNHGESLEVSRAGGIYALVNVHGVSTPRLKWKPGYTYTGRVGERSFDFRVTEYSAAGDAAWRIGYEVTRHHDNQEDENEATDEIPRMGVVAAAERLEESWPNLWDE